MNWVLREQRLGVEGREESWPPWAGGVRGEICHAPSSAGPPGAVGGYVPHGHAGPGDASGHLPPEAQEVSFWGPAPLPSHPHPSPPFRDLPSCRGPRLRSPASPSSAVLPLWPGGGKRATHPAGRGASPGWVPFTPTQSHIPGVRSVRPGDAAHLLAPSSGRSSSERPLPPSLLCVVPTPGGQ